MISTASVWAFAPSTGAGIVAPRVVPRQFASGAFATVTEWLMKIGLVAYR